MKRRLLSILFYTIVIICMGNDVKIINDSIQSSQDKILSQFDGLIIQNEAITSIKDGTLSGPALTLFRRESDGIYYIAYQQYYVNNILTGSFIDFYPNGVVKMILINILPNSDYPELKQTFPSQSYCYEFYESGRLKAEGWGLIEKDIEIGDSIRIGTWKYYDPDGKMKKVEYPRDFNSIDFSR